MLIYVYFTVIIFGLLFSKARTVRLLQYMTIFVIYVFNNWNQDDVVYRRIYSGYYGGTHEPAFDYICNLCFGKGISYETFRAVFVLIALVLLFFGLKKLFPGVNNRACSLVMLYPLLPFVELLRNLMAIAIVTCGIAWYLDSEVVKSKKNTLYVLIVLLAASFHYNVLFFLVVLFTNEKETCRNNFFKITIISITSILIFNGVLFRRVLFLLFHSEKVLNWFNTQTRIGLGFLLVLLFHIISFGIYDCTFRTYCRNEVIICEENVKEKKLMRQIYSLNIFSFVLMGLYTYNMEFFQRIYVFIILLNCFCISIMIRKTSSINTYILRILQTVYHLVMLFFFCQPFNKEGIMSFILTNNSLFP